MALPSLLRRKRGRSQPAQREANSVLALQRDMNRFFDDMWHGFGLPVSFGDAGELFDPRVDVEETETEVSVTAELPGLEEKDFELSVSEDGLLLRGEKREEHEDKASGWRERSYGSFERSIPLPCEVEADQASAKFKHGVLRVRLPKSPKARERVRRIPIATS